MPKPSSSKEFTGDRDSPVWTKGMFTTAKRLTDLPPELQAKLKPGVRGPQKMPTKVSISIRISADVVKEFRAMGRGWQGSVDDILRTWLKTRKKSA